MKAFFCSGIFYEKNFRQFQNLGCDKVFIVKNFHETFIKKQRLSIGTASIIHALSMVNKFTF
ncbi:MAG TPA: hypothetical protein DCQ50_06030 [Chryseobacterium sp.]|nr:hypothetical protein [Chryseobacterium sp.]